MRQAIAHAIDYELIINEISAGVTPSTSPFAYGWYRCDLERSYPYDPEGAKALLDEAGWIESDDGIRVVQGAEYAEDGTRLSVQMEGYTNFQPLVGPHPGEEWVQGFQLFYSAIPSGRALTRRLLDAAVPDRPVLIIAFDGRTA